TFAVPESQLRDVKKYMAAGKLPVTVAPQDDEATTEMGYLTFVDNSVDPATGTIKLKGTFPNKNHRLWPGQFVRVTLRLTTQANARGVPTRPGRRGREGDCVSVVKEARPVESGPVTTSVRMDQDMVVRRALDFGETVVPEGQLRFSPGEGATPGDKKKKGPAK